MKFGANIEMFEAVKGCEAIKEGTMLAYMARGNLSDQRTIYDVNIETVAKTKNVWRSIKEESSAAV